MREIGDRGNRGEEGNRGHRGHNGHRGNKDGWGNKDGCGNKDATCGATLNATLTSPWYQETLFKRPCLRDLV